MPVRLGHVHVVVVGGLLEVRERQLPLVVRHVLDLIEPRDRVAYVVGVGQRLLALVREGVRGIGQLAAITGRQLAVRFPRLPCRPHGDPRTRGSDPQTRVCCVTTNWAGNVTFGASTVHRPTSVADLQAVVAASGQVRALGTGHSFNRIADTTGDLISTLALPSTMDIDG